MNENFKEMMAFLGDVNRPCAVATVKDNTPKVRFFSFKMVENNRLYFITSKQKNVYHELKNNPKIEVCSLANQAMEWVRVSGSVVFEENLDLNKKAFSMLPLLEKAYGTPDNTDIALFYIDDLSVIENSMSGKKKQLF